MARQTKEQTMEQAVEALIREHQCCPPGKGMIERLPLFTIHHLIRRLFEELVKAKRQSKPDVIPLPANHARIKELQERIKELEADKTSLEADVDYWRSRND